ncbi:HAMP domain-containing histidine kinase [Schleiferiaceae bacterium]|nr:HAMP domain-containing histidine kinase [Schleiferiaceae bacterium]MDB4177102.1 HAMP domain-containing histidine kinase [Schleiferiaceae bacterium]MDC1493202.1 HAMP domain-containing histidine kinase [Schleiferiaceae bacterium]MDC1530181.1 HAMP domain-containing histidine kinase [Schleiferiaceae bacterium]MDC1537660.1 HAMP domain-containing histidine kinase [Schleiferiaceae bacterium]
MKLDVYTRKIHWKIALIAFGTIIGLASLFYTESFLKELRAEEELKIKRWAEAVEAVFFAEDDVNLSFYTQIIQDNKTIPVILTDSKGSIIAHRNLNTPETNPEKYLLRKLDEFKSSGSVLENSYADGQVNFLYYKGSNLLTKLRLYPLILLGVIGVYMLISYMAFSNARRSEQNKVWTGMAKETAHQIGTPLSALMGWLGYLKEQYPKENAFGEMEKDIDRLTDITDRFSKIGSQPERTDKNLDDTIEKTIDYLRSRLGNKITLSLDMDGSRASNHNQQLISWVLENMIKNSADAMDGSGTISVEKRTQSNRMIVLIKDTGRGITQADQRKIFEPGFTSKSRGWGLGLSLAKRIIEEYHGGKLTLEQSIPGEGTTFKISLPIA